ncbi:hypothetical protein Vretimale_3479 [Volvox reticuliferus]|uniref:Uncharacterized protein n=1 Tax=Volvox reticuliferus TaxID=1737510 RepID=A0A8J4G3M4_9CHLO|nr:hypothetical protein Vretimale_3479 [Volvox reticuliferus]
MRANAVSAAPPAQTGSVIALVPSAPPLPPWQPLAVPLVDRRDEDPGDGSALLPSPFMWRGQVRDFVSDTRCVDDDATETGVSLSGVAPAPSPCGTARCTATLPIDRCPSSASPSAIGAMALCR